MFPEYAYNYVVFRKELILQMQDENDTCPKIMILKEQYKSLYCKWCND